MKGFEIKTYRGGISDFEDKGIAGAYKAGSMNLDIRKKKDTLSCQQALVSETPPVQGFTDLMNVFVPASDGNTYGFAKDGKIYKRDSSGIWTYVHTNTNGAITGAEEMPQSDGKKYLYYAAGTKLGRKELPGSSDWSDANDSYQSDLTNVAYHKMVVSNGQLLIANDSNLASVDYEGNYSNSVLDVVPGNLIKTLIERDRMAILGCGRVDSAVEGYLFSWDQALSAGNQFTWNQKKLIPAKGVNALLDTEYPLAQVGDQGRLYWSDLSVISPLLEIPGGGYCNPEAVTNDDGLALFAIYGNGNGNTGIWSYGRKRHNLYPVLNLEYQLDCTGIGAMKKVGTDILLSVKIGTEYFVKRVDSTQKAPAVYVGLDLLAAARLQPQVIWNAVQVTTIPLPAATAVECWYRVNNTGDFKQANIEGGGLTLTGEGKVQGLFYCGDSGRIFEYEFKLTPNGNNTPEIVRHEVFTSV